MAKYDVGFKLESSAQAVDIRWRRSDETTWTAFGVFSKSPAVIEVPDDTGAFTINVRAAGADRRPVGRGLNRRGDTADEPLNRPDLTTAVSVAPAVKQDGPVLSVTPAVPAGFEADEYDLEVRVSDTSTTDAEDALQVGFVEPGQSIDAGVLAGEASQRLGERPVSHAVRDEVDGCRGQLAPYVAEEALEMTGGPRDRALVRRVSEQ